MVCATRRSPNPRAPGTCARWRDLRTGITDRWLILHTKLRIVTAVTGPVHAVPDYLTLHAEAVVDEAVRHIVAHPGTETVVVTATVTNRVTVLVEAAGPVGSLLPPLRGSAARARLLGGRCHIEQSARLVWSVPLPAAEDHARPPAGPTRGPMLGAPLRRVGA
ncbi:hypothetical protein [Nocardia africana]|uniref:Uncharacterized protein n=1 Tax=Nocardia africana TaxID=134964 RepID=A0ABW6NIC0_9NOCA